MGMVRHIKTADKCELHVGKLGKFWPNFFSLLYFKVVCFDFVLNFSQFNMWKAEFGYQVRGMTQVFVCTTSQ